MPDTRFYKRAAPIGLTEVLKITGATCTAKKANPFKDIANLKEATQTDITYMADAARLPELKKTKAGACLTTAQWADQTPEKTLALIVKDPKTAYIELARYFYEQKTTPHQRHPSATIAPSANIGKSVTLGPNVVIEENVEIKEGTTIGANTVIKQGVQIGKNCLIEESVVISHAIIDDNVIIRPGTKIGQPIGGRTINPKGHTIIPQLGRVIIEKNVQIGCNTTIDRGSLDDTIIGEGTFIDNLVHIGHGAQTGKNCILISMSGLSGGVRLGNFVLMGGQSGVTSALGTHATIGDGAIIYSKSVTTGNVKPGEHMMGFPARPAKEFLKQQAILARLAKNKGKKA